MTSGSMAVVNPLTAQIDILEFSRAHLIESGMWRMGIFVGTCFCLWELLRRNFTLHFWELALWAYVLFDALHTIEYPSIPYGDMNTAFQATAGQTFVEVLLIPAVCLLASRRRLDRWIANFRWLILAEIIAVWAKVTGLMVSPSFDQALMAAYLPFAPWWLAALSLITIVTHHGNTALLIIGAQLFAIAIRMPKLRRLLVLGAPILIGLAYIHRVRGWFMFGERLGHWMTWMKWWATEPRFILFGTGAGSFMWLSCMLSKFHDTLFLQMHSDILQQLFEYGSIGLFLAAMVLRLTVRRAQTDTKTLAAVAGAIAFMVPYHPLRFFPSAFLIMMIFSKARFAKWQAEIE